MIKETQLEKPFENIAIAFSGGGFRAAAFSLGTISYLERLGLTKEIGYLSSASGGTITNLLYASSLKRGEHFDEFYKNALASLNGDQLLSSVLSLLNDDTKWPAGTGKQRNLINSFARVYDSPLLFNGETMAVFWDNRKRKGLEICANATEFYRGLSFRFQADGTRNPKQVIGNNYLKFDVKNHLMTIKKIKLGDVLAASSCFPAGFEPICYPGDFSYTGLSTAELKDALLYTNYDEQTQPLSFVPPAHVPDPKQKNYIDAFGFMDGGITDNQGLASLMLADDKRRNNKQRPSFFGLMIITDVASYFMDSYESPKTKPAEGWRRRTIDFFLNIAKKFASYPSAVMWLGLLIMAICFIATVFTPPIIKTICYVLTGFFGALGLLGLLATTINPTASIIHDIEAFDIEQELIAAAKKEKTFSENIISKLTRFLSVTRLNVFEQMLRARLSSVLSMVMDVNLKQVRRLIYQTFYSNEHYENRRVPNFIYELSVHNITSRTNRINDAKRLTWKATDADKAILLNDLELIQPIAENARCFGTTLWFDEGQPGVQLLKDVVSTGQFTTCMNLVEYILSLRGRKVVLNPADKLKVDGLMTQLLKDLEAFKKDPYFLY